MIELSGVHFRYDEREILTDVNVRIGPGLCLMLGPNGSGKSTVLRLMAGVERPRAGRVMIEGRDLWIDESGSRAMLSYVPEHPDVTPYATIVDILQLVAVVRGERTDSWKRAMTLAGLDPVQGCSIRELSLGQRRRVLVACAMIGKPTVYLLDEPLESMDEAMRAVIMGLVREAVGRAATVVVATHDVRPFLQDATRALTLSDGKLVECPVPCAV